MSFSPSPQLFHATNSVLQFFAFHRPRAGRFRIFRVMGELQQQLAKRRKDVDARGSHTPATLRQIDEIRGAYEKSLDDGEKLVNTWARAFLGISLEALPEAAERWVAERDAIPTPAAFAAYARAIDNAEYRTRGRLDLAPQATSGARITRLDLLAQRVRRAKLDTRETARLWDLLLSSAATEEERQQVREGQVTDQAFDDALEHLLEHLLAQRERRVRSAS